MARFTITSSLAQQFIQHFDIPEQWVEPHFNALTDRFYDTDRQGSLRELNEFLSALNAWFYGPDLKPLQAGEYPRDINEWDKLLDYLNTHFLPENNRFSDDERALLGRFLYEFQDKRRAAYNPEILPIHENSNAVHAVSLYFQYQHFRGFLSEEQQVALAPHEKDILLFFILHDSDEFINEGYSAAQSYSKNAPKARPIGTELHRDVVLAYLRYLAEENNLSAPEGLLKRSNELLKALDNWKKPDNDELKSMAKALEINQKSLKELLQTFFPDVDMEEGPTKVPYLDLVLALLVKSIDRTSNNREHTAYQLLSYRLFPTVKQEPVLQWEVLEALRPFVKGDEQARCRLESSIKAIKAMQERREEPDPRNQRAHIIANPENTPLERDYIISPVCKLAYNAPKAEGIEAAVLALLEPISDLVDTVEKRTKEVHETLDHLDRSLQGRAHQFMDWLNKAGIYGQVGFGLVNVLDKWGVLNLPEVAAHAAAQGQWGATIFTMIPMAKDAFLERSFGGSGAVLFNAFCLAQMTMNPENAGLWLNGMLLGNSLWSMARNKHTVDPNNRLETADIRNLPSALIHEAASTTQFLLDAVKPKQAINNAKTLGIYTRDVVTGRLPNAHWPSKLKNLLAFHKTSAAINLAAAAGYAFNNPVLRGIAEAVLGGLIIVDGTQQKIPAWQFSGALQIITKSVLAADPNNQIAQAGAVIAWGLFGFGLMELTQKHHSKNQ